jgi:hypothetical protein
LDIDNTLADTWPSLNQNWHSEAERILNLRPLEPVIRHLLENYSFEKYQWVFLSSRNYFNYCATFYWLRNNNLPATRKNIILVQNPMEKIELINKYVKRKVIYFDDLTYNHENGERKFYKKEIELLKLNRNVEYHGIEEILIINNGKHDFK